MVIAQLLRSFAIFHGRSDGKQDLNDKDAWLGQMNTYRGFRLISNE